MPISAPSAWRARSRGCGTAPSTSTGRGSTTASGSTRRPPADTPIGRRATGWPPPNSPAQAPILDPYGRGRERHRGGLLKSIKRGGGTHRDDRGSNARDQKGANVRVSLQSLDRRIINLIRPESSGSCAPAYLDRFFFP